MGTSHYYTLTGGKKMILEITAPYKKTLLP